MKFNSSEETCSNLASILPVSYPRSTSGLIANTERSGVPPARVGMPPPEVTQQAPQGQARHHQGSAQEREGHGRPEAQAVRGRGGRPRNQQKRKPKSQGGNNNHAATSEQNRQAGETFQNGAAEDVPPPANRSQRRGPGRGGRGRHGGQRHQQEFQRNGHVAEPDFSQPPPLFDRPPPSNLRARDQGQRSSEQEAYLRSIRTGVQELSQQGRHDQSATGSNLRRDPGNRPNRQRNQRRDGREGNGRQNNGPQSNRYPAGIEEERRSSVDANEVLKPQGCFLKGCKRS